MMVYKTNIIEGLRDLSSYTFQKVAWFENDQGLCSSFSDDDAAVFEDTGLESALKAGEIVFGKEADDVLRKLNEMIYAIGYKRDERELIDAPEMQAVREQALVCLRAIEACDLSESTVELVG